MITNGNVCSFSFYVTGYDSKTGEAYGEPAGELTLEQAKAEFARQCAENPLSINTVLGVSFTTDRKELEPTGKGGSELLRRVNGTLELSEDYKLSQVLANEKLISINAIKILDREAVRLQRISDNATAKCAKEINDNAQRISKNPAETQKFIAELESKYGIDHIKSVLANELLGNYGIANDETIEYLKSYYNGKYNDKFSLFMNAEQIEKLSDAAGEVERSLTETQSKLKNSGLVYGDSENIRARSTDVAREILHHNELEDRGLAEDDELSL